MSLTSLLLITGAVCASSTTPRHMFHFIYGCYETDEVRVDLVVDDDTIGYADFTKQEMVWCLPYVPPSGKDLEKEAFKFAKNSIANCHSVLAKAKKADHGTPLRQEPPDLSIYTRYKAEEGVLDTLFCSANHFYPPTINFTWTKNGAEVTEGLLNLRFSHNKDGTFRGISTLSFTPQRGDVYSCWVSHEALERPRIITWESRRRRSPARMFFCASLILCLAGIGTGLYFFIKKPNYCCGCQ
ncbi:RLA class II histocompatibility antigen, DP alpha-1 chain [Oryzias latipes]|uniref:Nonclassical MHC class II antigen alpha chain n=1 Tax=Oryzias latipes TaxID=8090 RepID=H2MBU3_ORYLA|nr:RLA class II histocompatibility antigen, DP alpha-1 chain [Oryzias latipes]AGA53809.1 nonclassical MHC class II antigen alpha chain [Oryzias latipes]